MKSLRRFLIIFLSLFLLPISIARVSSSWTYFEGEVNPVSTSIGVNLGRFDYTPPKPILPGFDKTPSGQENSDVVDTIINHAVKENDEGSSFNSLHNIIHDNNHFPNSNFFTTVDVNNKKYGYAYYTGTQIKDALDLDGYVNFAMKLEGGIGVTEKWYVYTTDFDIDSLKQVTYVDEEGNVHQDFNHRYVYDVYKSELDFVTDFFGGGVYSLKGAVKGYCETAINPYNNPDKIFFNPDSFIQGEYVPLESISIDGPTLINSTNQSIKFNAQYYPDNASDKKVTWTSSDPLVATINSDGVLTPMKDGQVTIRLKSDLINVNIATLDITIDSGEVIMPQTIAISGPDNVVMCKVVPFKAIITPDNVTNKNAIWSTSDSSVAEFDEYGNLYVKEGLNVTSVMIYAKSALNDELITSKQIHIQLPRSDTSINGKYEIDNNKLVYFNAKEINLNETAYLYPTGTTRQAIKFVVPKSSTINTVNMNYSSSGHVDEVFAMDSEGIIENYNLNNGFKSSSLGDMTYFVIFSGSKPIEVTVS